MKNIIIILFLFLSGSFFICYADSAVTFLVECNLEMKNGDKISGFLISAGYGGSKYSNLDKKYYVFDYDFNKVPLTDQYFLEKFIQAPDTELMIFKKNILSKLYS